MEKKQSRWKGRECKEKEGNELRGKKRQERHGKIKKKIIKVKKGKAHKRSETGSRQEGTIIETDNLLS